MNLPEYIVQARALHDEYEEALNRACSSLEGKMAELNKIFFTNEKRVKEVPESHGKLIGTGEDFAPTRYRK